jgi:hypothetical protein
MMYRPRFVPIEGRVDIAVLPASSLRTCSDYFSIHVALRDGDGVNEATSCRSAYSSRGPASVVASAADDARTLGGPLCFVPNVLAEAPPVAGQPAPPSPA